MVSDIGLQEVIRTASDNRSYKLPTRPVIDDRIDQLFTEEKMKITALLERVDHVALTSDYWTSLANDSYLGVTAQCMHLIARGSCIRLCWKFII